MTASALLVAGLIGIPASASPTPAEAAFPGYNGEIAFTSDRDGNSEIYTVTADGSNVTRITNQATPESAPRWSPDGSKLAYVSLRSGNVDIYVSNADGSNERRLTTDPAQDSFPAWSPDGTRIAFASTVGGSWNIWKMEADGSNRVQLTNDTTPDLRPSWSPDGAQIAFDRGMASNEQIFVMNLDGSALTNITNSANRETYPDWSPDGTHLVFVSTVPGGQEEIATIRADGTDKQQLTANTAPDYYPRFSPDGKNIVFTSFRDGNLRELYVMNVDGTNQTRITTNSSYDDHPNWQPIPNAAPELATKSINVTKNASASVDLLESANDEEPLDPAYVFISTQPSHGLASIEGGRLTYAPTAGFIGTDSLNYQICDSFLLDQKCATAVLSISVQSGPAPATPTVTQVGTVSLNEARKVYYTGHRPTITGTAVPGSSIRVEINSDPIVLTTTANEGGEWSVTPNQDIPTGEHTVSVTVTKDGATSEVLSFTLIIDPSYLIPTTGATTIPLRLGGLGLLGLGLRLSWVRYRGSRRSGPSVPALFP